MRGADLLRNTAPLAATVGNSRFALLSAYLRPPRCNKLMVVFRTPPVRRGTRFPAGNGHP